MGARWAVSQPGFAGGLALGVSSGSLVALALSRDRRRRYAYARNEYLAVLRADGRQGGRLVRVRQEADLREISREPLRRFARGSGSTAGKVGKTLATAADALNTAEWPWRGIVVGLLSSSALVGWFVLAILGLSVTMAALSAAFVFLLGLAARGGDRW